MFEGAIIKDMIHSIYIYMVPSRRSQLPSLPHRKHRLDGAIRLPGVPIIFHLSIWCTAEKHEDHEVMKCVFLGS